MNGPGRARPIPHRPPPAAATLAACLALLLLASACATSRGTGQAPPAAQPRTFVLVHGATGGGWDWRDVERRLRALGHDVRRPTLTGLGDRVHLSRPDIGLSLHVEDVVNTILWEDLQDVILVGHSYGGMVIAGVAERIPGRLRRVICVDALVPEDGDTVAALLQARGLGPWLASWTKGEFLVPLWVEEGTPIPHDVPQARRTFDEPIRLANPEARRLAGTYVLTVEPGTAPQKDHFFPDATRARARGWNVVQLAADHVPERSAPGPLVELLDAEGRR